MSDTVPVTQFSTSQFTLAIITCVLAIISGSVLQFTDRIKNIEIFLRARFSGLRKKNLIYTKILRILYYITILCPLPVFLAWMILVGINNGAYPTISILFVSIFIISLFIPVHNNLFYLKLLVIIVSFLAAKMTALGLNFQRNDPLSFYGLTAISLALNAMTTVICIWVINSNRWTFSANVPEDLKQSIFEQLQIWKKKDKLPMIVSGGLYGYLNKLSQKKKSILISAIYILGLLVLLAYSLIGFYFSQYRYQAIINSLAALTTDIINVVLVFSSRTTGINPVFNTLGVVFIRLFIIIFTGDYWFAGYFLIYFLLIGKIEGLIVNKYYPISKQYPTPPKTKTNLLKTPQFALFVLIAMYGGLTIFLAADNQQNVIIDSMKLGENTLKFWVVGVLILLKSVSQFFHLLSVNIIFRKTFNMIDRQSFYVGCKFCNEYYLFALISYGGLVGIGFFLYSQIGANIIWICTVFLPIFYQFGIIFYSNWQKNDFQFFGNTEKYNRKIYRIRQKQQKLDHIKQQLLNNMHQKNKGNILLMRNQSDDSQIPMQIPSLSKKDTAAMQMIKQYQYHQGQLQKQQKQDSHNNIRKIKKNWRQQNISKFQAFRKGYLLPSDYKIILGIIGMLITLIAFSITAFFLTGQNNVTGFTIAVYIMFFMFCFMPVKKYFQTFQKINLGQVLSMIFGLFINYAFGIVSYTLGWNQTAVYTVFWAVINPFLITTYISYGLFRDKGLTITTCIFSALSVILLSGVGFVLYFGFEQYVTGVVFYGLAFTVGLFLIGFFINIHKGNSIPRLVVYIIVMLLLLASLVPMIYGFVSDTLDSYYGFMITFLILTVLIIVSSGLALLNDSKTSKQKPNYYSPIGFPVYKYNPQLKTAVLHNTPLTFWHIGWFMYYIFCLTLVTFLRNVHYGLSASMIYFVVIMLTYIYFSTVNNFEVINFSKQISDNVLKNAWKEVCDLRQKTLLGWFTDCNSVEQQLQFFEHLLANKLNNKEQKMQTEGQINHQQIADGTINTKQQLQDHIYFLRYRFQKCQQNQQILLVNFWINVKLICYKIKKQRMLLFIRFLRQSEDILIEGGVILVPNQIALSVSQTYSQAMQQLHQLPEHQRQYVEDQFEKYKKNLLEEQIMKQRQINQDKRAQIYRDQQFYEQYIQGDDGKIQRYLGSQNKWENIKKQFMKNKKQVYYQDTDMGIDRSMLPQNCRNVQWNRPTKNSKIIKQEQQIQLIQKQQLDDSHIVNALSVIDKNIIAQKITDIDQVPGAHLVKLYKFDRIIPVIIDNRFPVKKSQQNQWLLSHCANKQQIYYSIIQKAYAKIYGGYNKLQKGNMGQILAQITWGYNEQLKMSQYKQNLANPLYTKLYRSHRQGCILVGTSLKLNQNWEENKVNTANLKFTYKIVDIRQFDGNKLAKIKKPYNSLKQIHTIKGHQQQILQHQKKVMKGGDFQWNQNSPKWTKRMLALTGYYTKEQRQQYFWMSIDDLTYAFRSIHICHIFPDDTKMDHYSENEWTLQRTLKIFKGNQTKVYIRDFKKFPQYGIQVTQKCSILVSLRQKQTNGKYGKNNMFFLIQDNSGKRIETPQISQIVGICNTKSKQRKIFKQIQLKSNTYPCTFTLLVGITDQETTGSFYLSIFSKHSSQFQIIDDKDFI